MNIIGQTNLLRKIDTQVDNFPQFSILVGPLGSGRKTVAKYIANVLGADIYFSDNKVDSVREIIHNATHFSGKPVLYVFADADRMSNAAKNALLKITEEPPKNAYFIMTLQNVNNTLRTIQSRGQVFNMDNYTYDELSDYANAKNVSREVLDLVLNTLDTPGEVELLIESSPVELYQYVQKVVDNIGDVSYANLFKIANSIALKESDADKYNLVLFWKMFIHICHTQSLQSLDSAECLKRYCDAMLITSKYLREFSVVGINKQSTFDMWLLDIKDLWSCYE